MATEKHKRVKVEKTAKSEHTEQQTQQPTPTKRLYRTKENQMIAGVCSGLGEYFNIDPAIIRLIFVLATVFGGYGIIVYIVLWIILPEASTEQIGSEETVKKNVAAMRTKANAFASGLRSSENEGRTRLIIGGVLIGLGILFFMDNFGFFKAEFFWPILLIFIGIFLLRR